MPLKKTTTTFLLLVLVALFILSAGPFRPDRTAITETISLMTEKEDAATAGWSAITTGPLDKMHKIGAAAQPGLSTKNLPSQVPSVSVTTPTSLLPTQGIRQTAALTPASITAAVPTATPTATPSPSLPSPTASPTVTPTATAAPTATATPAATVAPTVTATPTATVAPTAAPTPGTSPHPQEAFWIQEIFRLTNLEREKEGIPALLPPSTALLQAAAIRAEECAIDGSKYFSHTRPDGTEWHTVLQNIPKKTAGENLWRGTAGGFKPAAVVKGWMDSEGHRKNILNPAFTTMGVGVCRSSEAVQPCYDVAVQLFIGN